MIKIKQNLRLLYFIGFLVALSAAFPGYIRSSFLEEFASVELVGLFFLGAALISLIAIYFFPFLIQKYTNYRVSLVTILLNILSTLLLITTHSSWVAFAAFVLTTSTLYLTWINLDVFIEKFTENVSTGKTRTVYFTFINAGWLISPVIIGHIIGQGNYRIAYIFAIFFQLIAFFIITANKKSLSQPVQYQRHYILKTLKFIWQNINFRGIYIISFLLQLFFSIAVIYVPIYLHENIGFSWLIIGYIFSFMLLPFIIFEIPAGVLADKYAGEKKILFMGFLIIASATSLFFFLKSDSPFVWGIILFLSRCGAALIEAMRESYFFKIVDVEDIDYINLFHNIGPLAYILGSGLSVLILTVFSIQHLFLFLSVILLSGLYFTGRIQSQRIKSGQKTMSKIL